MIRKIYLLFKNIILKLSSEHDTFCFALNYHKSIVSNSEITQKGMSVENDYINNVNSYESYTKQNGNQTNQDIINLLIKNQKAISLITNTPTFSYIVNINNSNSYLTSIIEEDISAIVNMISNYKDEKQINFILHSLGGSTHAAMKIVETLYEQFEKVNFLIPFIAHSAATMMCMSANKIIMTPESSLGPFDTYHRSPDTGKHLPVKTLIKSAKEARRAHNPLCFFMPKSLYSNWNGEMINDTLQNCYNSLKTRIHYPTYLLMKYMFRELATDNQFLSNYIFLPFWKMFSKNGRKASKIVKYFISTGEQISHDAPIMYSDLKNSGLHIELAENELLERLRETSFLSKEYFNNNAAIYKLFINNEKSQITFPKDENQKI